MFNLNIPTAATDSPKERKVVPMGLAQYGRPYEKRTDPNGRSYYWALWERAESTGACRSGRDGTASRQRDTDAPAL